MALILVPSAVGASMTLDTIFLEVDIHPRNIARAVAIELKLGLELYKNGTISRPGIIEPEGELAEATKSLVSDFYYKYPTTTIYQLMDQMSSSFMDLSILKKNTLSLYG
ncbi:hypothetical protein EDC96DRAFT_571833 [Choanephora cucurbitarum]|nr:hypothetical protein EDC96DRAFT_571833 [Choanephora cucurbitarum]